jgi:hypothetical protein
LDRVLGHLHECLAIPKIHLTLSCYNLHDIVSNNRWLLNI